MCGVQKLVTALFCMSTGAGVIAILLLPFIYTLLKHQVIMSGNVPKSQVEILPVCDLSKKDW